MATIISFLSPLSRRSLSMSKGVAIGSIALILAACGSDSTSGGNAASESDRMVATYDDLPVCSDAREGVMAYVKDKKVAYVCVGGDWTLEEGSSNPEDNQAGAVKDKSISGVSQKGPFLKGTTVTAYELDGSKSLLQTGRTFSGSITQDDGRFNLSNVTLKSSYVRLSANGFYRNEVTGENSKASITLNAVTDLSSRNTVNVNLLTHLEFDRVSHLMAESDGTLKIKDAKKQAEKEIFDAFHIDATGFGYSEDLDVFGKTEADAALLAISILLQGDRTESELTELLAELSEDLSDGKWDDDAIRAEIGDSALSKDFQGKLANYRSNVKGWGLSTMVPDFEKYVRDFWMGEMHIDCSTANDGESIVVPLYNGNVLAVLCSHDDVVLSIEGEFLDNRNGQTYKTVKIGKQVWMAENLNFKTDSSFCYNDSAEYCEKYGRLYRWAAAVGKSESECGNGYTCSLPSGNIQGVCPSGWHLPTRDEFDTLIAAVGGRSTAGNVLKSTSGWNSSGNGIDAFAFSALPASRRDNYGGYYHEGYYADIWSSTEVSSDAACYMKLGYDSGIAYLHNSRKDYGFSVRCLKD